MSETIKEHWLLISALLALALIVVLLRRSVLRLPKLGRIPWWRLAIYAALTGAIGLVFAGDPLRAISSLIAHFPPGLGLPGIAGSEREFYRLTFHGSRSSAGERAVRQALHDAQVRWLEFTGQPLALRRPIDLHLVTEPEQIPEIWPSGTWFGRSWIKGSVCQDAVDFCPTTLNRRNDEEKPSLAERFFAQFSDPSEEVPFRPRPNLIDYQELQRLIEDQFLTRGLNNLRQAELGGPFTELVLEVLHADTSPALQRERLRDEYLRRLTEFTWEHDEIEFPLCRTLQDEGCRSQTPWIGAALRFVREVYGSDAILRYLSSATDASNLPASTGLEDAHAFDHEFGSYLAKKYTLDKDLPKSMWVRAPLIRAREKEPIVTSALARIGTPKLTHSARVTEVAMAPDRSWIASVGEDRSLRIGTKRPVWKSGASSFGTTSGALQGYPSPLGASFLRLPPRSRFIFGTLRRLIDRFGWRHPALAIRALAWRRMRRA